MQANTEPKSISLAPMIGYTHKHFRTLARMLSKHSILYTEMLPAQAIIRNKELASAYMDTSFENPLACQLSGNDPKLMQEAAKILEDKGASEININVGCPSDKVQSGEMGACLMLKPELVAQIFNSMQTAVAIPVSIKCRLGVDEQDEQKDLENFIQTTKSAGCKYFVIHARKAWLQGLSPKQNRDIPPLNYARVRQIKAENPELKIILNGGLQSLEQAKQEIETLDGAMLGRALQKDLFLLSQVDREFFGAKEVVTRAEILPKYLEYVALELERGQKLSLLIAPLLSFFHKVAGGKRAKTKLTFARTFKQLTQALEDFI